MFNRTILTISPQATSWVRRDTQVLLLHHFTRRKIYLEDANAYFWEIIFKCSDFEDIKNEFCKKFDFNELNKCMKQLEKIGLIKIFYDI